MDKLMNIFSLIFIFILSSLISTKCNFSKKIENIITEKTFETLVIKQDDDLLMRAIQDSNYPILFWNNDLYGTVENDDFVKFPNPYIIPFENLYWQIYRVSDVIFRLYNAYLDTRELVDHPTVRILAMVNRQELQLNLKCLLWYRNGVRLSVSDVSDYTLIWHRDWLSEIDQALNLPYLINCPLSKQRSSEVPVAVTLTQDEYEPPWNALKIIYDKVNVKEQFAICVKGLDFPFHDISAQLVEWIELTKLLGANKIFIYNFQVHPNTQRVLEYYERKGFIEITPLTYSVSSPHTLRGAKGLRYYNYEKTVEEVIAYNDCWNKNMYKYDYISLLDVDEMIIPVEVSTWAELITQIETNNQKYDGQKYFSYVFREARFSPEMMNFSNVPVFMTMTRRVLRKEFNQPGWQVKSIHNTDHIITLHNHYLLKAFGENGIIYEVDPSIAQLNHYRNCDLRDSDDNCFTLNTNNGTIDMLLWKYYENLKSAVEKAFHEIGISKI